MSDFFEEALKGGTKKDLSKLLKRLRFEYTHVFWLSPYDTVKAKYIDEPIDALLLTAIPNSKTATQANLLEVFSPDCEWDKVALVLFPENEIPYPEQVGWLVEEYLTLGAQMFEMVLDHDAAHLIRRFAALGI